MSYGNISRPLGKEEVKEMAEVRLTSYTQGGG
jgi:hypothetical protein